MLVDGLLSESEEEREREEEEKMEHTCCETSNCVDCIYFCRLQHDGQSGIGNG